MRILLIEDEPELAAATARALVGEGYVVDRLGSLGEAIEAVMSAEYRAILLDRRLPDGDGLSLLPVLRTRSNPPPVIVLTALDDVPDRVAGLDAGAQDYLIKPFAVAELLARLRVMLRHSVGDTAAHKVTAGRLAFDLSTLDVVVGGVPLPLPRRELTLLESLMRRVGRVVLREHIEAQVYGFDEDVSSNALEVHVSRLRKRLSDANAAVTLHSIRGVGYMVKAD